MTTIDINDKLLSKNDQHALANRRLLDSNGVWCVNIIGAPGSGKTTLIERTADKFAGDPEIGVLVGDLETRHDAERIAAHGVEVYQIITGGTCHLTARVVGEYLQRFDIGSLDVLIVENVGNLVCPTSYYLGEHNRMVLVSTPEGDDKPLKYPGAVHTSDLMLVTKTDLAPYTNFDVARAGENARRINADIDVFPVSCTSGEGLDQWFDWFGKHAAEKNSQQA